MKTLFLHIGVHKTGSTSLQAVAHLHREALARQGLHVVQTGATNDGNHVLLSRALLRDPAASRSVPLDLTIWQAARDEIVHSPCPAALITSEEFTAVGLEGIAALAGLMEAASVDVQVMVFLRDQLAALRSNHVELLKQGLIEHDFASYLAMSALDADFVESIDRFNYQLLLQPWISVFGQDRIKAVHYQPLRDTVSEFFARIGMPGAVGRTRSPARLNTSPSEVVVRLLVLVNRYLTLCEDLAPQRRTQITYGLYRQASAQYPEGGSTTVCSASLLRMLKCHFSRSNEWVEKTFGLRVKFDRAVRTRSLAGEPTLPPSEIERWLLEARAGVAYSLTLVEAGNVTEELASAGKQNAAIDRGDGPDLVSAPTA